MKKFQEEKKINQELTFKCEQFEKKLYNIDNELTY